jgi:hypothetical protein
MTISSPSGLVRTAVRAFVVFATLTLATVGAHASVPSPSTSTIPACLPACPGADIAYTVLIRDIAANPIAGSTVMFDFRDCPVMSLCATVQTDYRILNAYSISTTTDAQGSATIHLRVGGTCLSAATIYADGVLMTDGVSHPLVSVANTDRDGNAYVDSQDQRAIAASGAPNPTADLDCNGTHDTADNALLAAHVGHYCTANIDPAGRHTWGEIKILYR